MTDKKQGAKASRRSKHLAFTAELRDRKRLRKERAAIHRAMTEAARMKRSKRKGTRDFEQNMRTLGFEPQRKTVRRLDGACTYIGSEIGGDVLDKYEAIR